ncbi:MAG TPA: hypothetical protein ENN44_07200 [Methanoculleus sp.]|nr:hypothetical protein [Methanoculleus sp.]
MAYQVYTFRLLFPTAAWKTADRCREVASAFGCGEWSDPQEIPLPVSISAAAGDDRHLVDELEDIFSSTGPILGILEGWKCRRGFRKRCITVEMQKTRNILEFSVRLQTVPDTTPIPSPVKMTADICELHSLRAFLASAESLGFPLSKTDRIVKKFIRPPPGPAGYARPLLLPVDITRIRVLKDKRPWKLYDLALGRWLEPGEERDGECLAESCRHLRRVRGYELAQGVSCTPKVPAERGPALSADLHLGHNGVINYYSRPFPPGAATDMDEVLIRNWNAFLEPERPVYYLGDFTYKAGDATNQNYLARMNGKISWIRGNHDTCIREAKDSALISYEGIDFLLIHNPKHIPDSWNGWVIHGHTHNNRLNEYPFFSGERKTVNVSVEVTGYRPVYLSEIVTLIRRFESGGISGDIMLRDFSL